VNEHGSSVQVTDREGNIVVYRVGELSRSGKNSDHTLENDAAQYSRAVEDLRDDMKMPENNRVFLRMLEGVGDF
jgi:hypothetical protein